MTTETLDKDTAVQIPTRVLTALDRCDRCIGQAYFIVKRDDSELMFCNHHGRKFEPTLAAGGWEVEDHTYLLQEAEDKFKQVTDDNF